MRFALLLRLLPSSPNALEPMGGPTGVRKSLLVHRVRLSLLGGLGRLRDGLGGRSGSLDELRGDLLFGVGVDLRLDVVQLTEQLGAEELAVGRQVVRRHGELGC